ncbi:LuxR C-terminal-related transcriptional regulator [Actinoplanes friuliensis]|uniref:Transcriptional regulatory protein degU n=1 Tax=Actinoplanes friuliensis DSM 7358 TaxID=1246995 RepID=U5W0N7_9ACTN|nr:LuxR C-terminal-related transcriptional regulator [Actinoplanes friuliensis]AGZ42547.1 transcriptional regulatory protein degU [Actinoplanes friuliensis DSM 7358]
MAQQDLAGLAAAHLRRPGLVMLTGAPGSGRSTLLRRIAATAPGPVYAGGGLAMLAAVPALALSRAVKARLPAHDVPLLAEAVHSRVRGGLLVLDDLQYADPATLAALPHLAEHIRVVVALRAPHRLPAETVAALRATATAWLDVLPLSPDTATDLARRAGGQLSDEALAAVVQRAGGNPLAITALSRQAGAGRGTPDTDIDQVAYAIATALADLPRPARTALAALGLLGRPAPAALLGPGADALREAGLVTEDGDGLVPVSAYFAETAAGLLDADARVDLHRALAALTPDAEAARHLAAAGDHQGAYRKALTAADRGGDRADLLLFACELPGVTVSSRVRIAAADALLSSGRPHAAARVLTTAAPLGVEADVLRGEALLQAGDPLGARAAVRPVPDASAALVVAARDRILLLADLATDPAAARDTAEKIAARYPAPPPGVAAALAAVRAAHRTPGWDTELAAAAGAGADPLTGRWSAWLLVEHLVADGRLTQAARVARESAAACAADLAYSWQTRFLAVADWSEVLQGTMIAASAAAATAPDDTPATGSSHAPRAWSSDATPAGSPPSVAATGTDMPAGTVASAAALAESVLPAGHAVPGTAGAGPAFAVPGTAGADPALAVPRAALTAQEAADRALRRAADLTDRALPADARGYAIAAAALVEADTGLLAAARGRLTAPDGHPATAWVAREAAWLDGQPDRAAQPPDLTTAGLLTGLRHITARWAAYDTGATARAAFASAFELDGPAPAIPAGLPAAARRTLTAWATGTGFTAAADGWSGTSLREQIRCLLAAGLHDTDPERAVAALLQAEHLADTAGLVVLAGRARRGLRRHHVHRDTRSPRSGTRLTRRETDVLRLVAAGEPTRRIAGQLGISAETVDTHIRAGMRKLGARTRTEAAALALTQIEASAEHPDREDGR